MKLAKGLLVKLIDEAIEHGGSSCAEAHPVHTHSEWEEHKKEEDKKNKAMAKISIKTITKLPAPLQEGDDDNWARSAIERTHVRRMKLNRQLLEQLIKEAVEENIPADALDVVGQVSADDVIDEIYSKISSTMRNWIDSNSRPIEDKDLPDILEQIKLDTETLMLDLGRTMGEEPELDEPEDLHRSALQKRGSYIEPEEEYSTLPTVTRKSHGRMKRTARGQEPLQET